MVSHNIQWTMSRILALVCVSSTVVGTGILYWALHDRALTLAESHARALLAAADSLAAYTREHVSPLVEKLPSTTFHPETEPSFAASQVFRNVGESDYRYHTPALNPTNPEDRPSPEETELIRSFREHSEWAELSGVYDVQQERFFYIARPLRVTGEACLSCHGSPEKAPAGLLARYGSSNGFGWKINEVVGIELLAVPVTSQFKNLLQFALYAAGCIVLMFVFCYVALSAALQLTVVRPLQALARAAHQASTSMQGDVHLSGSGVREIEELAASIERLRLSLAKAMTGLPHDEPGQNRDAS